MSSTGLAEGRIVGAIASLSRAEEVGLRVPSRAGTTRLEPLACNAPWDVTQPGSRALPPADVALISDRDLRSPAERTNEFAAPKLADSISNCLGRPPSTSKPMSKPKLNGGARRNDVSQPLKSPSAAPAEKQGQECRTKQGEGRRAVNHERIGELAQDSLRHWGLQTMDRRCISLLQSLVHYRARSIVHSAIGISRRRQMWLNLPTHDRAPGPVVRIINFGVVSPRLSSDQTDRR
jgi:hypothetical protein